MRVVLSMLPVWNAITPPLGLAYLKSSVQHAGFDCRVFDFSPDVRPMLQSVVGDKGAEAFIAEHPELYRRWAQQICELQPRVVGFSIYDSNLHNTALVAREVKKRSPDTIIISGGFGLTRQALYMIKDVLAYSDYVLEGEGEMAFVDFLKICQRGEDPRTSKQIWYTGADGEPVFTESAPQQDINTILLPDFSGFDRSRYLSPDWLPILFSRGCILNCSFCTNKWNHVTQRTRSGRLVFEELERNVREHGIKGFIFNDDSLISHITYREVEEFCDLAIASDLVIPWRIYGTRVDRLLNEPYIAKLKRAGLVEVQLGVESFSSRVQRDMGKSSNYQMADRVVRMFAKQGVKTSLWIIYGYPTETDEDFYETLNWIAQNPGLLYYVSTNAFVPNYKYFCDRPGIVEQHQPVRMWNWSSAHSTIEKRQERFLKLIEVMDQERQISRIGFKYHMGDPFYVKFFTSWDQREHQFIVEQWQQQQESVLAEQGRAVAC